MNDALFGSRPTVDQPETLLERRHFRIDQADAAEQVAGRSITRHVQICIGKRSEFPKHPTQVSHPFETTMDF